MTAWQAIAGHIAEAVGHSFQPRTPREIGGGCINRALCLEDGHRRYFVKLNAATALSMFEAEAEGLRELAASRTLRVPQPICMGRQGAEAYLVLEHLELGRAGSDGMARAGRQLAALHATAGDCYGWTRDNTIGSTPQPNAPCGDWIAFWRARRLGFQLDLAGRNGYGGALQRRGERLLADLEALFEDYSPPASLLHGDLWGGNMAFDSSGAPVVYDPALYYGDREADLAMTELFGGFTADFYAAYREAWPLDSGYPVRKTLYNLYHVLNHLNLFGGGYAGQAGHMIDRLLSEFR